MHSQDALDALGVNVVSDKCNGDVVDKSDGVSPMVINDNQSHGCHRCELSQSSTRDQKKPYTAQVI